MVHKYYGVSNGEFCEYGESLLVEDFEAFMSILKGFVGPAFLYLPHAFIQGGSVFSPLVVMMLSLVFGFYSVCLVSCHDVLQDIESRTFIFSYEEIMHVAGGNVAANLLNFVICMYQFCLCVSYLVFIAYILGTVLLPSWSVLELVLVQLPILLPLVSLRNVKGFSFVNSCANLLTFLAVCIMSVFIGIRFAHDGPTIYAAFNQQSYPVFLGTAILAYEGNATMLPVYGVMRNRDHGKKVVIFSYIVMTFLYVLNGMSGSLAFGTSVAAIEILAFSPGLVRSLISAILCGVVILTLPFQFFIGITIVEDIIFKSRQPRTCEVILGRWLIVGVFAGLAVLAGTSFDHFTSLMGTVLGIPMGIFCPMYCHFKLVATKKCQRCAHFVVFLFAVGGLILCTSVTSSQWMEIVGWNGTGVGP